MKAEIPEIPVVYEVQNFGASRQIPTHIGSYFIARNALIYESDPELVKALCSVPFVEVRKKLNLTGFSVQVLRKIASKRRIQGSFRLTKSELIKRLGGIELCPL